MSASSAAPASPSSIAQQRAVARERVHAMESLAATIAHELRASVMGISSAAQLLRFSLPQDPTIEKHLGKVLQESERLSALHEALTEYCTELPPQLIAGNPADVWQSAIRYRRGALDASGVTLDIFELRGTVVMLDAEQLERAFDRCLQYALGRVQHGAALLMSSSTEGEYWQCTLGCADSSAINRHDSGRPTFQLALAQRTIVAHGGSLVEIMDSATPQLVVIRLPMSSRSA